MINLFASKQLQNPKEKKNNEESPSVYLIKVIKNGQRDILKEPDVKVKRQLSEQHYIVSATANWLNKHQACLQYSSGANHKWKLSPQLIQDTILLNSRIKNTFHIIVLETKSFRSFLKEYYSDAIIKNVFPEIKTFEIECTYSFLSSHLLLLDNVLYVGPGDRMAKEESTIVDFNDAVNRINLVHSFYPSVNGSGLVVSVKENKFDTTDIDLAGRIVPTSISSSVVSSHATNIATIIAGGGNSFYSGKGGAWGAQISSADFKMLLPDITAYQQYKISVQNHSYGVDIENFYGIDALAYDENMITNTSLMHVFSSGNSGDLSSSEGPYKDIAGFANLTGSFKMAKNILTVGSVNSYGVVSSLSSKGPAYDGRIKPDLVAYGESGSSQAAAIASGVVLLLQDAYSRNHSGTLPENVLIKSILINSADYVDNNGINFFSGYGNINAFRAIQNIIAGRFFSGKIEQAQEKTFMLHIPDSAINLKLTLSWNDLPAAPNAFKSLVNDLDLKLINRTTGEQWMPWVLNSFPNADSLRLLPVRKRDSLNVVEQITLNNPLPGEYTISVKAANISGYSQHFYVAYQWDTLNHFRWNYPSINTSLTGGSSTLLRWDNNCPGAKGKLDYSLDDGISWILIDSVINLGTNYYQWNVPATFSMAIVRMTIDNRMYTNTFNISMPLSFKIGFDCTDSIYLYWHKTKGIKGYNIFSLENNYLSKIGYTTESSIILAKNNIGYPYVTIAPTFANGLEGLKSYTINAKLQGIGCYIKNFLADLQDDNSAKLTLTLGTNFNVKQISLEKQSADKWAQIQLLLPNSENFYLTNDNQLTEGINNYRGQIELTNGKTIYTDIVSLYYISKSDCIIFPNPVNQEESIQVLLKAPLQGTLKLYDYRGGYLLKQFLTKTVETISLRNLQKGVYIVVIEDNNRIIMTKKLIII